MQKTSGRPLAAGLGLGWDLEFENQAERAKMANTQEQMDLLRQAFAQISASQDKVMEAWKSMTREQRLPYLKNVVSAYKTSAKKADGAESRTEEEVVFEQTVLKELKVQSPIVCCRFN